MARLMHQSDCWGKEGQLFFEIISINKTIKITVNDEKINIYANNIKVNQISVNSLDIILE